MQEGCPMPERIINKKAMNELREHLVDRYVLREIGDLFDTADIPFCEEYQPNAKGERRVMVERYFHSLDLTQEADARKLLYVFQLVIAKLEEGHFSWGISTPEQNRQTIAN